MADNIVIPKWLKWTGIEIGKAIGVGVPVLGILAVMADDKIDAKYTTDADLAAHIATDDKRIKALMSIVEANAEGVKSLTESNSELSLTTTELQITMLEQRIADMERDQENWEPYERSSYNDQKRHLNDLEKRRSKLIESQ